MLDSVLTSRSCWSCHLRERLCMGDQRLRALSLGTPHSTEADSEKWILQPPRSSKQVPGTRSKTSKQVPGTSSSLWTVGPIVNSVTKWQQEAKAITDWPDPKLITPGWLGQSDDLLLDRISLWSFRKLRKMRNCKVEIVNVWLIWCVWTWTSFLLS